MQNVILVIHILACIALTAVVLLQRSEGGALGIGGGGPGGGLMSGRGAAGALVRTTMIFAGVFFLTSLVLTTIAARGSDTRTAVERTLEEEGGTPSTTEDLLDPDAPLLPEMPQADPLAEGDEEPVPEPADPLAEAPVETPQAPAGEQPEDAPQGEPGPQ